MKEPATAAAPAAAESLSPEAPLLGEAAAGDGEASSVAAGPSEARLPGEGGEETSASGDDAGDSEAAGDDAGVDVLGDEAR